MNEQLTALRNEYKSLLNQQFKDLKEMDRLSAELQVVRQGYFDRANQLVQLDETIRLHPDMLPRYFKGKLSLIK